MHYENQDNIITLDEKKIQPAIRIGISSIIGTRKQQQDTVGKFFGKNGYVAVVCDGMGGLDGGELASRTAVGVLETDFRKMEEGEDPSVFLKREAKKADEAVYYLRNNQGNPLESGTTMATVFIQGNRFFWMSVGDSRIYFIRQGNIFALTREHNYQLSLDILKKRGMISESDYLREAEKGDALISYVGMGNLALIDGNEKPIILERNDQILLCSDGVYKSVEEKRILDILQRFRNVQDAAECLTQIIEEQKKKNQDNASVVLIQYS